MHACVRDVESAPESSPDVVSKRIRLAVSRELDDAISHGYGVNRFVSLTHGGLERYERGYEALPWSGAVCGRRAGHDGCIEVGQQGGFSADVDSSRVRGSHIFQ